MRASTPLVLPWLGLLALACSKPPAPAPAVAPTAAPSANTPATAQKLTLTYFTMPG